MQGVLSGCAPLAPVSFYIQARDTANGVRGTGGDAFTVRVTYAGPRAPTPADSSSSAAAASTRPAAAPGGAAAAPASASTREGKEGDGEGEDEPEVSIVDEQTGRYLVTYTVARAGKESVLARLAQLQQITLPRLTHRPASGLYVIHVSFDGSFGGPKGPIRGSPFKAVFDEGASPDVNRFGSGLAWEAARELVDAASATARQTLEGITREVADGQLEALLAVKNHLSNVSAKEAEVRLKCDVAQGIVEVLRRPGVEATSGPRRDKELASAQARLDKAALTWEEAKKYSATCRAAIAPHVKTHSISVRNGPPSQ